jgi:type IV pilus assembly protein PilW
MTIFNSRNRTSQSGFSLVEIMVALVVGLLATMVIMQVFSVFEVQKRSTTGSADAQTNGGIALYSISREMQLAGYPLLPDGLPTAPDSALECATVTVQGVPGATHTFLSPVIITDNVGPATSDSITLQYGDSLTGGGLSKITAIGAPGPNDVVIGSNLGCNAPPNPPDTVLIINGPACAISTIAGVPVGNNTTVTLSDTTGAALGASLSCLGSWTTVTFSVANGNLLRNGVPVMEGIVSLQAQYGISATPNSNTVTGWFDATGAFAPAAITLNDRNRIKAVRIAVVARNGKKETGAVTTLPVTIGTGPGAPVVDLSGLGTDWNQYRYRVFDTVVPLRNVIWAKGTL